MTMRETVTKGNLCTGISSKRGIISLYLPVTVPFASKERCARPVRER